MTNLDKTATRKIWGIIIHCTASKEGQEMTVAQIDKIHRKNGWAGIGYHFLIHLDGRIEDGRDINKTGAHTGGYNTGTIGICYVGGLDKNGDGVISKYEWIKSCPCFEVADFVKEYKLDELLWAK